MKTKRIAQVFLALMGLAFCKVGMEALANPQAVLGQVGILLENPSALSSMRAVYGGMHLVFGAFCFLGIFRDVREPLQFVVLYTTGFVIGRISGIVIDGLPNPFVMTWLATEAFSCITASALLVIGSKPASEVLQVR